MATSYAATHRQRVEAQRAPRARRQSRESGLAAAVAATPSCFDGRKVAVVDRGIASLDALPDRYAGIRTLYVSKNSLRSLEGVEQFGGLRALSAADNALADLDELRRLPAAGIQLEAASFEGNPMAALPNYRAHVIHMLGPQLAQLDNRPVTAEERAAAGGAVAHEATLLALMTANACLVHKLGRAVQLVKLHAELQCAVLGGWRGTTGGAAAGGGATDAVLGAGRGISRVLAWWDYEGGLCRQERHAIGLAIRREVGRRHRGLVLAGGRPEGSTKLWQQAFAQVMLLQQETIASLMRLLEDAKAEAAAALAPLTRPPSPAKRRALEGEAEAAERVRRDREGLIQELRDALLALADAGPQGGTLLPAWEARIRELHAALEAAGDDGLAWAGQQQQQQQQGQPVSPAKAAWGGEEAPAPGQWAIQARHVAAVEPASALAAAAATATTPRQLGIGRLKSSLRPLRPSSSGSGGWSPAKPSPRASTPRGALRPGGSAVGSPEPLPRPTSARLVQIREPGAAPQLSAAAQRQQPEAAPAAAQQQLERRWQADDGLAAYEEEQVEQARCTTPRPFQRSGEWGRGIGNALPTREPSGRQLPPALAAAAQHASAAAQQQQPQEQDEGGGAAPSLPGSRAGSPQRSRPGSPSQWTPNPLARQSTGGGGSQPASRPGSPGSPAPGGLQGIFNLLQREGRLGQVEALRGCIAAYETSAAELQASNLQLSEALQAAQQRSRSIEARFADKVASAEAVAGEAAAAQQAAAAQLAELEARAQDVVAGRAALQEQLEAAAAERQQLVAAAATEREAAAAAVQQLRGTIAELEGRPPIRLSLAVSYEAEWRAEAVRAAALAARAAELQAEVAAHQQQARLEASCSQLAQRVLLRRALLWWREAAAERACMGALQAAAEAHHRRTLLSTWLPAWRLAAQRSKLVAAREAARQQRSQHTAWEAWRLYCQDRVLRRGLDTAAGLHRETTLLAQAFGACRCRAAACRQVELPPHHPLTLAGAELQRRRALRACLGAWRLHMQEAVLPRMAAVQVRLLEQLMGSQRRALLCWQQYAEHRRERRLHKEVAGQHRLRALLSHWRQAAAESREERGALLRGSLTSRMLLLRRAWRGWRAALEEQRREAAGLALAESHHRAALLAKAWAGWGQWTAVCRGMGERHAARLLAAALASWRLAAKSADKRRLADAFCERASQCRFAAALHAWREAAAERRRRRAQGAHVAALLQRRSLGRALAGWRRAALAGKLCHTLAVVRELQAAVERVSDDLAAKAQQIESLQSVTVTVEGASEQLSLQVSHLDADLQQAQAQAATLHATAQQAQQALVQALADAAAAEASRAAASAERDAAVAERQDAEAGRAAACAARETAEHAAAEAGSRAEAAAAAAAEAMAQAAASAAALDALLAEHAAAKEQLDAVHAERQRLATGLERALAEAGEVSCRLERLQEERDRLRSQHEAAQQRAAAAEAEQQAALRQAGRLSQLCEQQREASAALHAQVAELQGALGSQAALQEQLARVADHNQALLAKNAELAAQLERSATAVQQAEGDQAVLQAAAAQADVERQQLQERAAAAHAEQQQLSRLADALRVSKLALEQQLAEAQAAAAAAEAEHARAAAEAQALRGERDGLAAAAAQLQEDKGALEGAVGRLRDQLEQSNGVLDSCRQLLGDCCSMRTAAADEAQSLQELLRGVKAELLLRDASIRALTRENAQRGERLRALQAHIDALGQQVAAARQPSPGGSQALVPGRWDSPLTALTAPAVAGSASASVSQASGGGQGSWALGAPMPGSPVSGLFASPAASYMPLASHQQRPGSASAATATTISPPASSSPGPAAGSPGASAASGASSAPAPAPHPPASPATAAAAAMAAGNGDLLDSSMAYLLELVVQKRLAPAQAQQVINAATEGDARPLLSVLEALKPRRGGAGGGASRSLQQP